jgi:transformation/transcription domain-associated protein
MLGTIKTWRTRLPLINDNLSYWNDIFTWRQYHFETFTKFYEKQNNFNSSSLIQSPNPAMLGVHALAQCIVNFGRIARKQHLYDLCLETLNKIHKKQSVPIIDCFLKVKQEIKCYIDTFDYLTSKQASEMLDVIEATNLRYFTKENVSELISLKASFLQLCNKYDEANQLFSFSIYLNDAQPKLWGAWGDYLTKAFIEICNKPLLINTSGIYEMAESALISLFYASRNLNGDTKSRKYISKIIWLLTFDNEKKMLHSQFDTFSCLIPPGNWLSWIPQIITLLVKNDESGKYYVNLINQIMRNFPQAIYYPLRTLYLKLKNDEQTEKLKIQILTQQRLNATSRNTTDDETKEKSKTANNMNQSFFSSDCLIRVTTLMHRQREMHPTLFNTLEGLIDQIIALKVNWYEELERNFKQTLNQCYLFLFENMKNVRFFMIKSLI